MLVAICCIIVVTILLVQAGCKTIEWIGKQNSPGLDFDLPPKQKAEVDKMWKDFKPEIEGKEGDLSVVIKQAKLDSDKVVEYQGEGVKAFEFRPQNFKQFIGQEEAKEKAKTIIKKVRKDIKTHFIVDGIKGHGKTTFVELLAKELQAHLITRVGKQIDEESLVDIINEINTCPNKCVLFFIDEIDTMDWKIVKILNPIIEQYKINGKKIKPFIFAGATINKHLLIKNNPDTLDRIPTHIKFVRYNKDEIATILKQYKEQLYPNETLSEESIEVISKNCKFNPRTSIALLEDCLVEKDVKKVLNSSRVVRDGLTAIDVKLLQILNKATRPMGANALAMKAGLKESEYLREFEPFLVEYEYINRVPSRIITDKGKKLLGELHV